MELLLIARIQLSSIIYLILYINIIHPCVWQCMRQLVCVWQCERQCARTCMKEKIYITVARQPIQSTGVIFSGLGQTGRCNAKLELFNHLRASSDNDQKQLPTRSKFLARPVAGHPISTFEKQTVRLRARSKASRRSLSKRRRRLSWQQIERVAWLIPPCSTPAGRRGSTILTTAAWAVCFSAHRSTPMHLQARGQYPKKQP